MRSWQVDGTRRRCSMRGGPSQSRVVTLTSKGHQPDGKDRKRYLWRRALLLAAWLQIADERERQSCLERPAKALAGVSVATGRGCQAMVYQKTFQRVYQGRQVARCCDWRTSRAGPFTATRFSLVSVRRPHAMYKVAACRMCWGSFLDGLEHHSGPF